MVSSGPPGPVGGTQSISPALLRSNSSILRSQGGGVTSQPTFSSLISPRNQYNSMNLLGNMANVSSLLNQSFGNGGSSSGLSVSGSLQCSGIDQGAESDPLSTIGNGMGFNPSPQSFAQTNPTSSGQSQGQQFPSNSGNQLAQDQQQPRQLDHQNFSHGPQFAEQFGVSPSPHHHQQYQSIQAGFGSMGSVKLEPQTITDQNGHQQQLQASRNLSQVKLEPQHIQNLTSLTPIKMEPHHSDQSYFLQQQQQQFLQLSRQSSQAAAAAAQMNILQQQRFLQLQQQQQFLKGLPQQRSQLQQQFQQQNLPMRTAMKAGYEPGMCARRLMQYMYHQQHRPADNNIEFWKKFVAEYFAPHAKKRWCVSLYGSGRHTTGIFPQDVWHCEICNKKPGRGFETTVEVLPRLCKIKYDSGTLEELLYVDMPCECQNASGQIVLDYAKAVQESVFEQLRVVREGQLRIVFSLDLKICSWEFCARRHEELIPRRSLIPQVGQLGAAARKYQAATQNGSSNLSAQELQNNCNMFVSSARQLAKALEVPLVNDLGYTKRYVRCLQIAEVVNSMKDLIDYSWRTGTSPMASLINFPKRTSTSSGFHHQGQQPGEQQQQSMDQDANNGPSSVQTSVCLAASNGIVSANNSINNTSNSASAVVGLLGQNSIKSRQEPPISNANNNLYGGSTVPIPSAGSSTSLPQAQPNPSSPFPSPTPSVSNNQPYNSRNASPVATTSHMSSVNSPVNVSMQQPAHSSEADPNDSQSSVHQIIQEMMSSRQNGGGGMVGGGSSGNDMRSMSGISHSGNLALNGGNGVVGNGSRMNSSGLSSMGFRNMGVGGVRVGMGSVSMANGRVGVPSMPQDPSTNHHQQQDLANRLNGLGAGNNFNQYHFDWKPSP